MAADKYRPHHPAEYARLLEWARGASSILEIGSRFGYTLVDLAHVAQPGARIVAVDLPGAGDWGNAESGPVLQENVEKLKREGYDAHLFLGDSTETATIKTIDIEYGPFDFVFIDGDHRYFGVKADWLNYGRMGVRVAFHDIRQPGPAENPKLEVWRLWQEIKATGATTEEFIAPDSKMGIGLVRSRLP